MTQAEEKSPLPSQSDAFIRQRNKGRRTFIFIALLFFGPFILAALAFRLNWAPKGESVNKGALVQVEAPLIDRQLELLERDELLQLRSKWSLLIFVPDVCDSDCRAAIDKFEIVHFRLNRDVERVQIVGVNDNGIIKSPFARKVAPGDSTEALLNSMQQLKLDAQGVYVVDPRGFVVSRYEFSEGADALQKDLKRLLKYSRIG